MSLIKYLLLTLLIYSCNDEKYSYTKTQITPTIIDSLNSESEIEHFIHSLKHPFFRIMSNEDSIVNRHALSKFELKAINEFNRDLRFDRDSISKRIADSLHVNRSYYKADFDNNGYTDLLIIGDDKGCTSFSIGDKKTRSCDYSVYSLMSFGRDSIRPISLIMEAKNKSVVPQIIINEKGVFIEIHEPGDYHWIEKKQLLPNKTHLLEYVFDSFIESNNNVEEFGIEKIVFSTDGCHGSCPRFDLVIYNNGKAELNAIEYNSTNPNLFEHEISDKIKGQFKTYITKEKHDELINLLNYINFANLEEQYSLMRLHTKNCSLKVTYNNGKEKIVEDAGMTGSYGLQRVYQLLYDLRLNQNWEQISDTPIDPYVQ